MRKLTRFDVLSFDPHLFPIMGLSENHKTDTLVRMFWAWVSYKIRTMTPKGFGSHFFWYHKPHMIASQDERFEEHPMKEYLEHRRLKFYSMTGPFTMRRVIQYNIECHLEYEKKKKGWTYDFDNIKRKYLEARGLIGSEHDSLDDPEKNICTDWADLVNIMDPDWEMNLHRDPTEIDVYCSKHPERFECLGIYYPERPKRIFGHRGRVDTGY